MIIRICLSLYWTNMFSSVSVGVERLARFCHSFLVHLKSKKSSYLCWALYTNMYFPFLIFMCDHLFPMLALYNLVLELPVTSVVSALNKVDIMIPKLFYVGFDTAVVLLLNTKQWYMMTQTRGFKELSYRLKQIAKPRFSVSCTSKHGNFGIAIRYLRSSSPNSQHPYWSSDIVTLTKKK